MAACECRGCRGAAGRRRWRRCASAAGIPEVLRPRYEALAVVPPDTPLPMTMLRRLWGLASEPDAEATANLLEGKVRHRLTLWTCPACMRSSPSFGLFVSGRPLSGVFCPEMALQTCAVKRTCAVKSTSLTGCEHSL